MQIVRTQFSPASKNFRDFSLRLDNLKNCPTLTTQTRDLHGENVMQKIYKSIFQLLGITIVIWLLTGMAGAENLEDVIFIQGEFDNASYKDACVIFSGNIDSSATAPNNGDSYLQESSFGAPMSATVGWVVPDAAGLPDAPKNAAEQLLKDGYGYVEDMKAIFNSYYQNEKPLDSDEIYLAFDWLTNGIMNNDGMGQIEINGELFDADMLFDEDKAANAKKYLFTAFNMNPYLKYPVDTVDVDLRYLLLDIPYYQCAALLMQGNLALERAFYVRFFEDLRSSGPVINDELKNLGWNVSADTFDDTDEEGAWKYFNEASQVWLNVFTSPIQRSYLLEFAPLRTLDYQDHPAFKDTSRPVGLPSDADWPPIVYEGYKDVASMLTALSQRARVVQEVASRLVLKLEKDLATGLIQKYVQEIALEESVIMSMFFPDGLPDEHESKYPGMAESFLELRDVIAQLGQLRNAAVNPRLNALGFDKDVLFIRSVEPTSPDRTLYTFNWLKNQLLANEINPIGALGTSFEDDETAKKARKNFDLKATTYLSEFDGIENEYNQQLISLCGPDTSDPYAPNLENPISGGGLLQQQNENVQVSLNAIERVKRQMENVHTRIKIEQDRVEQLGIVSDKRIQIIYETGNKVAQLEQEIADIQTKMKLTEAVMNSASSMLSLLPFRRSQPRGPIGSLLSSGAAAASAAALALMQKKIGEKQVAITKLQTEKEAKFEYLNQESASINSAAQVKIMFLELRTLEIDMYDAEIRYTQEVNRLAQMYNEIENKVMRRDRALERLTRRSFADPTYRIEATSAALKAEDSFSTAQIWVYFMAKALAYKWPLEESDLHIESILQEILQARTAEKLKTVVDKMRNYDTANQGNPGASYYYWNYSLRDEYLGMTFDKQETGGNTLIPYEQFRAYLNNLKNMPENIVRVDGKDHLAIPFSTVTFNIEDDTVISANLPDSEGNDRYASATPIFQTGLWDSKIDWVQVNIVGTYDTQTMEVFLWYGGSTFVRTRDSFTSYLPDPDVNVDVDFIAYSNPAYSFTYQTRGFGWKAMENIKQKMTAKLVSDPRNIPDVVFKNEAFRERPVAATDWRLLIPLNDTNIENIRDIEINILYTARTKQDRKRSDDPAPETTGIGFNKDL